MNIYTYFTPDEMLTVIARAEKGTAALFKHLQVNFAADFDEIVLTIADCMPQLVAEDSVYKAGTRKGQRKLTFHALDKGVDAIVARELTNTQGWKEFHKVKQYCEKTMTQVVLTPPENSDEYSMHWIRAFLTRPDFTNVKEYYRNQTIKHIANTQKMVDEWIKNNNANIDEIMTWNGEKYNEWHFANH